ncbi:MAG TPA: NADH-quinone oxidoreductase subunit NuoB [Planctomycetaceae bacterium]|nr:NADH-quinone oxidoreductase subunit NuoB [Planctomycetaceae bacterium]
MLNLSLARLRQGHRTIAYPAQVPTLPDRFRGLPIVDSSKCPESCRACADACPTNAITIDAKGMRVDLGRCLFCTDCSDACPEEAIHYSQEYRLSTRSRDDLILDGQTIKRAQALEEKSRRLFGRSLKLRQVSAGGCNACEADLNVLGTVVFDMGRFGIQFVASPRHADGIVVTGAVSENMRTALLETYAAVPAPKLVIAVGACAISGGPFIDNPEVHNGCGSLVPVDLFIPGCPPHPLTILDGLLRLLGRLDGPSAAASDTGT